jgi:hypothetical protein
MRSPTRSFERSPRGRWLGAWPLAAALAALAPALPSVAAAQANTPPQPATGQLGGEGPCAAPSKAQLDVIGPNVSVATNLLHPTEKVWVIRPSGTSIISPRTGGSCTDNARPVVLLIHGFPANELIFQPTVPSLYAETIRNLVSNGHIVVFPRYDWTAVINFLNWDKLFQDVQDVARTVTDGFKQAVDTSVRMDKRHLGVLGHSLGGGVSPIVLNSLALERPLWGTGSRWLALNAPSDMFYRCTGIANPFYPPLPDVFDYEANCSPMTPPPSNTRVLFMSQMGDFSTLHIAGWRMYEDMPIAVSRKWGVIINSDCSHKTAEQHCVNAENDIAPNQQCPATPATATDCMAGHLLMTEYSDRSYSLPFAQRQENHLNFYGIYRNLQALADCARSSSSASCSADRTFMGIWSDGTPATPASNFP